MHKWTDPAVSYTPFFSSQPTILLYSRLREQWSLSPITSSHFLLYSRLRDISSFSAPNTHSHQIAPRISYNIPIQQYPPPTTPLVKQTYSSLQLLHTTPNIIKYIVKKKSEHPKIHSILLLSNSCQGALSGFHLALSKDDLTKRKKNKNKNKNKPHRVSLKNPFLPGSSIRRVTFLLPWSSQVGFHSNPNIFVFDFFEFLPLFYFYFSNIIGNWSVCRDMQ